MEGTKSPQTSLRTATMEHPCDSAWIMAGLAAPKVHVPGGRCQACDIWSHSSLTVSLDESVMIMSLHHGQTVLDPGCAILVSEHFERVLEREEGDGMPELD